MSAKKRPKVPRELVAMFYRVRWPPTLNGTEDYVHRRHALERMRHPCSGPTKLYRVTVWRKKG